ncbi:MAG: agmatinase [Anaerolineaceae bacterium]|nr:agmatinase [Anaerolineaceae bacterium]
MKSKILTFANLPASNLNELDSEIAILGIPYGTPYHSGVPDTVNTPTILRKESIRYPEDIASWDFDLSGTLLGNGHVRVADCGDLPGNPNNPKKNYQGAVEAIQTILQKNAVPIVIGGDDSIPIPIFQAFENHEPIHILQIDAHIDWRHDFEGITHGFSSTMRRASEMPWVEKIIQVGARGTGSAQQEEFEAAQAYGAHIITAQNLHQNGVESVLELIPEGCNCYITLDCDGLDPSVIPAVGAPAPGGLTYTQILALLHGVSHKAKLSGFNLVEFVPHKDVNGLGAIAAFRILWNVIGALVRSPFL